MIDVETARELALALPEVIEQDHWGRPSFRVKKKIFATLWPDEQRAMVKLALADQAALIALDPKTYFAVPGAWGYRGATFVDLKRIGKSALQKALQSAWSNVAPKLLVAAHEPDPKPSGDKR